MVWNMLSGSGVANAQKRSWWDRVLVYKNLLSLFYQSLGRHPSPKFELQYLRNRTASAPKDTIFGRRGH